jgi:enoyl-CoA hydratase
MIERSSLGPARVLRMAHGKASALDLEFLEALTAELDAAARDEVRAVVLTGTGSIFSAGVDLIRLRDGGNDYLKTFLPAMHACFERLFFMPMPTVAAVNGHAIAGGGVLTLACDHRLMARGSARIGLPEHVVGVPFPVLVLEMVRATLSPPVAQEALLRGSTYVPDEALARGFVNELVDAAELLPRAEAVATELAAIPPTTYRLSKERLRRPVRDAVAATRGADDSLTHAAWDSQEVRDALREYVAKTLKR